MEEFEISADDVLVGHSAGSNAALKLAERHQVKGLIVVSEHAVTAICRLWKQVAGGNRQQDYDRDSRARAEATCCQLTAFV